MFDKIERARLESIHFRHDPESRLNAIIAIHNTRLGPALGGCRCIRYSNDNEAIDDVIKLARGMSYKAALAGVPQGGGKAVIMLPADMNLNRHSLYQAFGQFVHSLDGYYITAADSGTQLADLDQVATVTPYVSGTSHDGYNPSPLTALGVFAGIKAAVRHQLQRDSLKGLHIAIQGVGNVGFELAGLLHNAGARLTIADTNTERARLCAEAFHADQASTAEIIGIDCDVFSPCGLGGILNNETIPRLRCAIVAGAANNQLQSPTHGLLLQQRDILYAPDYVINAGGLITVSLGFLKKPLAEIRNRTLGLKHTLLNLFERSRAEKIPPGQIADRMAEDILYGQLT
ncbi:Glu/Leu/Phe/Val dehydrogenase family protein [Pseudohongiella spirulinae]|uniref:Amino acid dehydrogenase n=1 Tax=Pseudohongiella spirulinae TaxID=1249552 RepID=A0A0S2KB39_9GAMM|nr:Glu/Leu/Phe/Val dehydrogenase family protein [Pseudohongiella spirulinae]ALO45512.1 Amino acid dehydrogenase [Pseudohongiella spirulinae]